MAHKATDRRSKPRRIPRELVSEPLNRRIEEGVDVVSTAIRNMHTEQPLWPVLFSLRLIRDSLNLLRDHIEKAGDTEEAWKQSSIGLHYPVSWDAEKGRIQYDGWDTDGLKDEESIRRTIGSTVDQSLHVFLLQSLTRGTAIARFTPETIQEEKAKFEAALASGVEKATEGADFAGCWAIPLKDGMEWGPLFTPEMAEAAKDGLDLQSFLEPFVFFRPNPLSDEEIPDNAHTPQEVRESVRSLVASFLCSDVFDGRFSGTDPEGRPFSITMAPAVYHLVVDSERDTVRDEEGRLVESHAFYPFALDLKIEGEGAHPWKWPEEDRAHLWSKLVESIDCLAEDVREEQNKIRDGWGIGPKEPTGQTGALAQSVPEGVESHVPARDFPMAFMQIRVDAEVQRFVESLHTVRFPVRKWTTLPKWEDLVSEEIQRLKDEEGERAFEDLQKTTGDPDARKALLRTLYPVKRDSDGHALRDARGNPIKGKRVQLTAEGERRLKVNKGLGLGYRQHDKDGKEYLVRLFQVGSGYVEVGLSWLGIAGPWVEEWRKDLEEKAERLANPKGQLPLQFEDLPAERQAEANRILSRVRPLKHGHKIMEAAIAQVGVQGQNPIRFPAIALRVLLNLEKDPNWKAAVEGGLNALRAMDFRVDSFDCPSKVTGRGSFLGEWWYKGAGRGRGHGSGDYFLDVQPGFLGCLSAFESDRRKLRGRWTVHYDFGKKLTEGAKEKHGWNTKDKDGKVKTKRATKASWTHFDSGRPFYNAAEGLTPAQEKLHSFVEREITLEEDSAARGRANVRVAGSRRPRFYDRSFCPLLEAGRSYEGALGHFRTNPESGRTLGGSRTRASATGGRHTEGLIAVLGRSLTPGNAYAQRRTAARETLQDIKAVVVEYLGGTVAARLPDRWLTMEEAGGLRESELLHKVRWFFFLPEGWRAERRRKWEKKKNYAASRTQEEADKALEALRGQLDETTGTPLRERLRGHREAQGLSQGDVARLFGVSQKTISNWEKGAEPDENGTVRGKPIPQDKAPLLQRWIDTGEPPSEEAIQARRPAS